MGIQGLLPKLKSITEKKHIKEYKGQRVAVDGYVWLHRGAYCCCSEICQNIKTDKYLGYGVNMVEMLKYYGIKPVVVLDGKGLPMKQHTEKERRSNRQQNLMKATEHLRKGNHKDATEYFKKAVDITPEMANCFIEKLKQLGVEYVVAPYEADAQLAYLQRTGHVALVITEDSDLIPFGCTKVFYKMDRYGNGEEINQENLGLNKELDFKSFTPEMIIRMCILTGCDYLNNIDGVGIVNAYKIVKEHQNTKQILKYLEKNYQVPHNYSKSFVKAEMTFHHQMVYNLDGMLVPLTPFPENVVQEKLTFLGLGVPESDELEESPVMDLHHYDAMLISSLSKPKRKNNASVPHEDDMEETEKVSKKKKTIKSTHEDIQDDEILDALTLITNAQMNDLESESPDRDETQCDEEIVSTTDLSIFHTNEEIKEPSPLEDLVNAFDRDDETQLDMLPSPPREIFRENKEIIILSEDSMDSYKMETTIKVYQDQEAKSKKNSPKRDVKKTKKKSLASVDKNQKTIHGFLKDSSQKRSEKKVHEVIDLSQTDTPSIFEKFFKNKK